MKRTKINLATISKAVGYCEEIIDVIGLHYCELSNLCIEIIENFCALRGVKITNEQAHFLLLKIGTEGPLPCYSFIRNIGPFSRCSKAQIQNWLDLGQDAVIKFHS